MVGQNLTPLLHAAGHAVVGIDKNQGFLDVLKRRTPGVTTMVADLSEDGSWAECFEGADTVIDLKAQITSPSEEEHRRNNEAATSRIVHAAEAARVGHLIHASSTVVLTRSQDFYTSTKRAGEARVRNSTLGHTILRPPLMYGPGDIKHLGLVANLMERLPVVPVPGNGRYVRQPLFVGDFCRVVMACLQAGPQKDPLDIVGHERIDFIDLLRKIRSWRGFRCLLVPVPLSIFRLAMFAQKLAFGKERWTRQQLDALTAGDDFQPGSWVERLEVSYTPFEVAGAAHFGEPDDLAADLLASQRSHGER